MAGRPRKEDTAELTAEFEQSQGEINASFAPVSTPSKPKVPEWVICTVDVRMATRPSTHPYKMGRGVEGYCTDARILETGRTCKRDAESIAKLNKQVDWRNSGKPNHHVFYIPADKAEVGVSLNPTCEWVPTYQMGRVVGYNFELKFNF
jgi:hypothetical protein